MTSPDWLSLRTEDLGPDELAALAADPALRAEHADAMALGRMVADLPGTGGPPFEALAQTTAPARPPPPPAAPSWRRLGWTGGLVAALALVAVGITSGLGTGTDMRDKAIGEATDGPPAGSVVLQAAAEGPDGLRPLGPTGTVASDERVLFQVRTTAAGSVSLLELGPSGTTLVWGDETWSGPPGTYTPGGTSPQSYRPDHPDALGATLVYHALLCARPPADPRQPDAACVTDSLTLTWAE